MILESEHVILDTPSALCTYYMEASPGELPAVAVASGSCIFIYRNLRPYFKFSLPALDIHPQELEVWEALTQEGAEPARAVAELCELRDSMGVLLTPRSQDLLAMEHPEVGRGGTHTPQEGVHIHVALPLAVAMGRDLRVRDVGEEGKEGQVDGETS